MGARRPSFRFGRRIGMWLRRRVAAGGGGGDVTPPGVSAIVINADGASGRITFDEAMNTGALPTAGSLTLNNTPATVVPSAWFSATELDFTIGTNRVVGSSFATVTMTYVAGATPLEDAAGNDLDNFSGASLTNNSIHAPMVHVETLYGAATLTSANWTSPVDLYGTSVTVEAWAPGQGGQAATGSGEAGDYVLKVDTIAANTAYAYTIGAVGATGRGAAGDITWRTNVAIAPGGGSATAAVGDTVRAGGAATNGGASVLGGGSSGSSTAAALSAPGEPNGAIGVSAAIAGRWPGTGGSSQAGSAQAGTPGWIRLACLRHPPLTGPYVTAWAEYRDAAAATTRNLAAPGTHVAGDIIIAIAAFGTLASPACAQATEVLQTDHASVGSLALYARTADGTDTLTITSSSNAGSFRVYRVRGSTGIANVEATGAQGAGSAPNAGTHTPTGGAVERLVFAFASGGANAGNASHSITAHPASYLGVVTPQGGTGSGFALLATGTRRQSAASYAPSWADTLQNWVAITGTVE